MATKELLCSTLQQRSSDDDVHLSSFLLFYVRLINNLDSFPSFSSAANQPRFNSTSPSKSASCAFPTCFPRKTKEFIRVLAHQSDAASRSRREGCRSWLGFRVSQGGRRRMFVPDVGAV